MKDRAPAVDAHAYVDNCLTAEERKAFEARLRQDGDLRRRVELWQAQSEAIRSTFGAPGSNPPRSSEESRAGASRLAFSSVAPQPRAAPVELGNRHIPPSPPGAQFQPKTACRARRAATFAAFVLIGITLFPSAMAYPPRGALGDAGAAAFRAFWTAPAATLDFRGVAAQALSDFLGPAFLAARLPEWVVPMGWRLRGAKRVPGLQGEAAFILLEDARGRALGVLVEPLDAPASSAIRTETRDAATAAVFTRRGYGIVVVGQAESGVDAWLSASGFLDDGWPYPIR